MKWDWKEFYKQAMDWIINYGPRILIGLLVFFVGLFLVRLLNKWVKKAMQRGKLNPSVRYFLQNLQYPGPGRHSCFDPDIFYGDLNI